MRRITKLNLILSVTTLALGVAAYSEAVKEPPHFAVALADEVTVRAPERVSLPVPELSDSDVIAARPVFAPDRRPPAPPEPAPTLKPAPAKPPAVALKGIAEAGEERRALLEVAAEGQKLVRIGESVLGWKLLALDANAATFERSGKRHVAILGAAMPSEAKPATERSDRAEPAGRSRADVLKRARRQDMSEMIDD